LDAELDSLSRDLEAEVGHPDKYSEDGIVIVHGKNPAEADLERAAVPPVGGIVAKFGSYNFENGAGLGAIYGAAADADHTTGSLGRRVDGRRLRVSATAVHKLRDSDLHRVHVQRNFDFLAVQEVTDARPGKYPATAYDVNPHVIQFVLNGGTRFAAPVRDNMRFVQDQHSNAIFYDQTKWAWVESMQVMRKADPEDIGARPGLAEEVKKYTLAAKFRHIATGVHVWVVSVHLKAISGPPRFLSTNIKVHQPEVNNWLRRVLAKVGADEDTMIVAGGDFNDNAHDALMRVAARDTQNLIAAHNRRLQPAFAHRTNTHIAGNMHETDLKHGVGAFFGRMGGSTHSFDGLYSYNKVAVDVVVPGRVHSMDLGNAHSISDHCLIDWTIRLKCPACAPPPLPRLPGLFDEDEDEGYAGGLFDEDEDEDEDEEEDRDFDEDDEPLFQNDLPPSMMSRGGKLEALLAA
jgi:endonuclease/exonuclease/phosphatase family metal-dependent hydrolase